MAYGPEGFEELPTTEPRVVLGKRESASVVWLNVTGLTDVTTLTGIGADLELHPLVIEDIANTEQRAKVEFYDRYIYIVVKMLRTEEKGGDVQAEQVSILVFPGLVVTFQERSGDVFESIRNRIRNDLGRVRRMGADYLAYALIDAIADNYYVILEHLEQKLEPLEESILTDPAQSHARELLSIKREIVYLRRTLWPLRELLVQLQRDAPGRMDEEIQPFLRDLQDHVIQVIELLESFEEMAGSILDTYLSAVSNRMNDVMRVLTIIATIFIPLTFIVGVYGMNFEHMPELSWRWAYPTIWGVMAAVVLALVFFFRRKKWL
jgi:magnesium transporter